MTYAACAAGAQAKLNKVDGVTNSGAFYRAGHVTAPACVSASDLVAMSRI